MDLGEIKRTIEVWPIEEPVPVPQEAPVEEPDREEVEV